MIPIECTPALDGLVRTGMVIRTGNTYYLRNPMTKKEFTDYEYRDLLKMLEVQRIISEDRLNGRTG